MREKETLAYNLKRLRQFKGLTQEDLAKKVGLTKYTISNLELGKQENIGLKYLISICRELDISIEELFIKDSCDFPIRLVISDENVENIRRLFGRAEYVIQIKAEKKEEASPDEVTGNGSQKS